MSFAYFTLCKGKKKPFLSSWFLDWEGVDLVLLSCLPIGLLYEFWQVTAFIDFIYLNGLCSQGIVDFLFCIHTVSVVQSPLCNLCFSVKNKNNKKQSCRIVRNVWIIHCLKQESGKFLEERPIIYWWKISWWKLCFHTTQKKCTAVFERSFSHCFHDIKESNCYFI